MTGQVCAPSNPPLVRDRHGENRRISIITRLAAPLIASRVGAPLSSMMFGAFSGEARTLRARRTSFARNLTTARDVELPWSRPPSLGLIESRCSESTDGAQGLVLLPHWIRHDSDMRRGEGVCRYWPGRPLPLHDRASWLSFITVVTLRTSAMWGRTCMMGSRFPRESDFLLDDRDFFLFFPFHLHSGVDRDWTPAPSQVSYVLVGAEATFPPLEPENTHAI